MNWKRAYKTISAAGNWMYTTRWTVKTDYGQLTRLPKSNNKQQDEDFDYYFRLAGHLEIQDLPDVVDLNIETGEFKEVGTEEVIGTGVGA